MPGQELEEATSATYDGRAFTTWAPQGARYRTRALTPFVPIRQPVHQQKAEEQNEEEHPTAPHNKAPRVPFMPPLPPGRPRQPAPPRRRRRYRSSPAVQIEEARRACEAKKPPKPPDRRTDPLKVLSTLGVSLRLPDTSSAKAVRTLPRAPFWAAAVIALVIILAVALHFLGARLVGPEELYAAVPVVASQLSESTPPVKKEAATRPEAAPLDPPIPIRIRVAPTPRPRRHLLHHSLFARRPTRVVLRRPRRKPKRRPRRHARAGASVHDEVDALLSGARSRSSAEVDADALLSAGSGN